MKQNRFTFPFFRKKYLINDVATRVGNTRLDLNLKRLFPPPPISIRIRTNIEPLSFARSLAANSEAVSAADAKDGRRNAKKDADETGPSNA